jgi:hypothetical protein
MRESVESRMDFAEFFAGDLALRFAVAFRTTAPGSSGAVTARRLAIIVAGTAAARCAILLA